MRNIARFASRASDALNVRAGSPSACIGFYIDRIEEMVLDILRRQFADTSIIEMYVNAYQEELKRSRSTAFRQRAGTQKLLDEAKAEITRLAHMCAKGLISEDELPGMLAPLRIERDRQQAILESVEESVNIIELQPKAVIRFREDIETLAQIVRDGSGDVSPELAVPFRQMVAAVVIDPRQPGEPYRITIKGFLSSLIGGNEHSVIRLLAGDRYQH